MHVTSERQDFSTFEVHVCSANTHVLPISEDGACHETDANRTNPNQVMWTTQTSRQADVPDAEGV